MLQRVKAIKTPEDQISPLWVHKWSFHIRATLKSLANHIQLRATNICTEGNHEEDRIWSQIILIYLTIFINHFTIYQALSVNPENTSVNKTGKNSRRRLLWDEIREETGWGLQII